MTDREPKKIDPDNDMPENIKRDPKRDLGSVPSSFNPGNQAGKGRDAPQQDQDLPPPQQQAEMNPKQQPKELRTPNPGQTGTPGGKGNQDGPQNQKR